MRKVFSSALVLLAALAAGSGCNQVHVGFARFQLINHTPYAITYYAVARSERTVMRADNLLDAPIEPDHTFDADVHLPGEYWLRAIAVVDGTEVERVRGPVHIFDNNRAWAWYTENGDLMEGTEPRDIYAVTDLPAVTIDTNGQAIPDDPKVRSTMQVAFDPEGGLNWPLGEPADYDGFAGIEVRGNSSQTFDKQSFGVETWDDEDEGTDVELLGLPEEEDWVFYGPWMDRSLVRNAVGYAMWGSLGYYAPRTRFVELYLNTDQNPVVEESYHGVYVLTEKIKRDKNRVDIKKLDEDDLDEDKISGGYILELTGPDEIDPGSLTIDVAGDFLVAIEEPDPDDIPQAQADWITKYLADFEAALFGPDFADPELGYAAYIDVDSWVDYILVQDFYKSRDAFRSSTWMYKDRGKKLAIGPVWDLNIAFGYFSFNGFQNPEGWYLQQPKDDIGHSPWTDRLFQDPAFVEQYIARWKELRQAQLSAETLAGLVDGFAEELRTANVRNFVRWQTLGKTLLPDIRYLMFLGPHPDSWQGEIEYLKHWIEKRGAWIDAHIDELRNLG
ncbi:MAG: hypothetical protein GC168_02535 [Candidatus Hydrogenedens sp.]|nr:hypothetical protein [Candidatus Hydrogenedens sp.]